MDASAKIMNVISSTKRLMQRADEQYHTQEREVQRLSSGTIDWYGDGRSQIAQIAILVRKMNEEIYTSLQALVKNLDEECRPLLSQNPSVSAVREVVETIKSLNSLSEFSTDFNLTLDGVDRGGLTKVAYEPSMESKMIQKYWEAKYASMPESAGYEWKLEDQRRKADAAEAQRALRARQARESADEAIRKHREEELEKVKKELEQEHQERMNAAQSKYEKIKKDTEASIEQLESQKKALEEKLPTLGFFQFGEKKRIKQELESIVYTLEADRSRLSRAESELTEEQNKLRESLEQQLRKSKKRIDWANPLTGEKPSPRELANQRFMGAILNHMVPGRDYRVSEILKDTPGLPEEIMTNQWLNALLRNLVSEGELIRSDEQGVAYYRLAE